MHVCAHVYRLLKVLRAGIEAEGTDADKPSTVRFKDAHRAIADRVTRAETCRYSFARLDESFRSGAVARAQQMSACVSIRMCAGY